MIKVLIAVHDNGPPPETQLVYKYFLGEIESSNIGLYASRKLAEDNGYNLYYNEKPRKEFVLEISKL